jgi:E3 ubiquitin-protein ligase ATL6/9/15/31/42/55
MAYTDVKAHKASKGTLEYAVCLSEYYDDKMLFAPAAQCSHVFHPDYINTWLSSHVTCPVCHNLVQDANTPPVDDAPELKETPMQELPSPKYAPTATTATAPSQSLRVDIGART